MNNVHEEVKRSYGDVFNNCLISSHSTKGTITYDNWKQCYADFNSIVKRSIENTKKTIYKNKNYAPVNGLNIMKGHAFMSEIQILTHISEHNIGAIYIFDHTFLHKFSMTIRYYYPDIKMEYFAYVKNPDTLSYVNYVDRINVKDKKILDHYEDPDIIYVTKPVMGIIKLITFGTFDLFHVGHDNIFKKCIQYSDRIVVGLSTDDLTFKKKAIYPDESYEARKQNILKQSGVVEVFPEESMEMKAEYIATHKPNIFVMGDDWKGKFDWVDCCVIYPPRTPGISSTELRKYNGGMTKYNDMNIIHAGGQIDKFTYTNSLESIMLHIRENSSKVFEIDIVKIKDAYVIAHDDTEKKIYNYDGKFIDITLKDYKKLLVQGSYTPMDFIMLRRIILQYPDRMFILDIKENAENYYNALEYVKGIFNGRIDNLIPQIYCPEDYDNCIQSGYGKCLIALWKRYGDIFSKQCYDFFEYIEKNHSGIEVFGVSAWYKNYHDPRYSEFKRRVKNTVYFHGQTWNPYCLTEEQMKKHNDDGIYFFKYTL